MTKTIAWTFVAAVTLAAIACQAPSSRRNEEPVPREASQEEPGTDSETATVPESRPPADSESGAVLSAGTPEAPVDDVDRTATELPTIDADESHSRVLSNDGAYLITYASEPETLPLNEPFSIVVRLYRPETGVRIEDSAVRIEADADMPAHRHGMVRVPKVTKTGPGEFRVDGMMMHMPGYWQLYVDVIHDGITERAQFDVDLD